MDKTQVLKAEKKLRKVYQIVVFGNTDSGKKEDYVNHMGEPASPKVSMFMAVSKKR